MSAGLKTATGWAVLALYLVLIVTLLRPGTTGAASVSGWGAALTGLVAG
jgi:hypothetical protein